MKQMSPAELHQYAERLEAIVDALYAATDEMEVLLKEVGAADEIESLLRPLQKLIVSTPDDNLSVANLRVRWTNMAHDAEDKA